MTHTCRRCHACEQCKAKHGHLPGCIHLCPTCLEGTLVQLERRIMQPEQRSYSCGCPWIALERLVFEPEQLAVHQAQRQAALADTRLIVARFLEARR